MVKLDVAVSRLMIIFAKKTITMRLFTFIMGGIVGIALFAYLMAISGYDIVRRNRVFPYTILEAEKPKTHYFTVNGPKGEVSLNTEMKRDSVRILLGKPAKTEFYEVGNSIHETWTYEFAGKPYRSRIMIVGFIDEKVESVSEI